MSHLIFTLDFHEIVRGQLKNNSDCLISYDPLRIAAGIPNYVHGSTDFEFTAHLSFLPEGTLDLKLFSEIGWVTQNVIENNGTGSMLTGTFKVPADTEEIIVWFTMTDKEGHIYHDSKYGKNFHFRIESQDIQITKSIVIHDQQEGLSKFQFTANSILKVDNVVVRYRITNSKEPFNETPIPLTDSIINRKKEWKTGSIEVPYGSVVVYDLLYFIGENKFKLENNGNYYLAEPVNAP